MKNKVLYWGVSVALLASCTDEVQELCNEPSQALKQIVMTTQDFQPEAGSRTLYEIGEAVKCTWAANDTVGVFPEEGAQVYFPMASGAGTKNAMFDGEGWALKDGRTYGAYYPCIDKFYLDRNAVPVDYSGQTQMGNASTAHLGVYDYMVAAPVTSEFGSTQFTFKHLSALVQLRFFVPQPATLTSVILVAESDAFALKGTVDIMADVPGIASVTFSKKIVLNLRKVSTTEENQVVTLYMMLPPVDLSTQTLKLVVTSDKGTQEIALEGKNFQAGTAYGLSGELVSKEAGYKDGVVTLTEAGTLKNLLGDDFLSIESLKVVGPINGDDVRCLRQMLGCNGSSNIKRKFITLDLSYASIVEGGNSYFKYEDFKNSDNSIEYYTSNNVIGDYMFFRCSNYLQEIVLPLNIVSIGQYAFSNSCISNSMDISDNVTSIGDYAFSNCGLLNSVTIGDGVNTLGDNAFSNCSSLKSVTIGDGINTLGDNAFSNCDQLVSVTIGKRVFTIGEYAFAGCDALTTIDIPDNVISIGDYAFSNCGLLNSVTIGDGVNTICDNAFSDCDQLVTVTIGKRVSTIGESAFADCDALTTIDIPDNVTSMGESAFSGCGKLASVMIGKGLTTIGESVFAGCDALISIDIPDNVFSIGDGAFYSCSELASVTIGNGVTTIGDWAFHHCDALKSIYIPDGVISIGACAFKDCEYLTSVTVGDGDTSIGEFAFEDCDRLASVTIGNGAITIGNSAFADCDRLASVTIGNGATTIGNYAFADCVALTSIDIPDGVTRIGISAFRNCRDLTSVTIGDGVITIDQNAFYNCYELVSLTIGKNITTIGEGTFAFCLKLTSVHITDLSAWCNIKFNDGSSNPLCNEADLYLNNKKLTELVLPEDITELREYAFYQCRSIKELTIGDGVTKIGDYAFCGCTALKYLTIGKSVSMIGEDAFSGCNALIDLYCYAMTPPSIKKDYTFGTYGFWTTLYVPAGCSAEYKSSFWYRYFKNIEEMKL